MVVSREEFRTKAGREQFVQDFEFICGKSEVPWQDQIGLSFKYHWFLKEITVRERVELLDKLTQDQYERLRTVWHWFSKWMETPGFITSLDIKSERKAVMKHPSFSPPVEEEKVEEDAPVEKKASKKKLSAKKKRALRRIEEQQKSLVSTEDSQILSNEKRQKLTYKITVGRYQTIRVRQIEKKDGLQEFPPKDQRGLDFVAENFVDDSIQPHLIGKAEKSAPTGGSAFRLESVHYHTGTNETMVIRESYSVRCYQEWVFEFEETADGITHVKQFVNDGYFDGFPTAENPDIEPIGNGGVVHDTGRFIYKFFAQHEKNFADTVSIDAILWSTIYDLPKFPWVKNLTIKHHSHMGTHWWLRRCKTMRKIPNVTVLANRDEQSLINPSNPDWRKENPFKNSEALEYILPVHGRELSGVVRVIPYAEHPVFWAEKLTFQPCITMRLRDLKHIFALNEFNANMTSLPSSEINEFLWMWNAGRIGHRIVRVAINVENANRFVHRHKNGELPHPALEGLDFQEINAHNNHKLSEGLRNSVMMKDTYTFVIYRTWKKPEPTGQKLEEASQHPLKIAENPIRPEVPQTPSRKRNNDSGYKSASDNASSHEGSVTPPENGERKDSTCSAASSSVVTGSSNGGQLSRQMSGQTESLPLNKVKKEPKWICGTCAIVQFKKSLNDQSKPSEDFQTSFHFTAVRNYEFAKELLAFWND